MLRVAVAPALGNDCGFLPHLSSRVASLSTGRNESEIAAVPFFKLNNAFHHFGGHLARKVPHNTITGNPF